MPQTTAPLPCASLLVAGVVRAQSHLIGLVPTRTVSIRLSGAHQTGVGTIADPFVVRARMDSRSDGV